MKLKRALSALLAMMMIFSLLPASGITAFAAYDHSDMTEWTAEDGQLSTSGSYDIQNSADDMAQDALADSPHSHDGITFDTEWNSDIAIKEETTISTSQNIFLTNDIDITQGLVISAMVRWSIYA